MFDDRQFARTIRTDIKRAVKILPGFFSTAAIFIIMAGMLVFYARFFIFSQDIFTGINVAYCIEKNDTLGQGQIDMFKDMESIKESAVLISVESEEQGKALLADNEVTALLVIPGSFSANFGSKESSIRVYFNEDGSLETYLVNDIVKIISRLYSTTSAAISTFHTVLLEEGVSEEEIKVTYNSIYTKLFTDVFSRTTGYEIEKIDSTGTHNLEKTLISSMMILIFFLMSFQLTPYYKGHNSAYKMMQKMRGVSSLRIGFSEVLCGAGLLYVLYLFEFVLLRLFRREIKIGSLITIIPMVFLVAVITYLLSEIIESEHIVDIVIFLIVITGIYLAGGFIPLILMPKIIGQTAIYNPFTYLIKYALFVLY
ncbi:MAG: ABC transporter permease [Lachnospiraceae bacterium]|nr:ABC transporter permease [Lachnospiraceae bacterium]